MSEKGKEIQADTKAKRTCTPLSMPKRLFSISEAAIYLARPKSSIRGLIWKGKLPYIPEGRRQFIDVRDLDQYIERNKTVMF